MDTLTIYVSDPAIDPEIVAQAELDLHLELTARLDAAIATAARPTWSPTFRGRGVETIMAAAL